MEPALFQCSICLGEDMLGEIFICTSASHAYCGLCCHQHVATSTRRGNAATCPECRIALPPSPLRARCIESMLQAKHERIAAEEKAQVEEVEQREMQAEAEQVMYAPLNPDSELNKS